MIQWNPESVKPSCNQNDNWDKEHGISQRVIVAGIGLLKDILVLSLFHIGQN